jgi:divalent metal cation (Fe/Co/Zn/Cd) transporter
MDTVISHQELRAIEAILNQYQQQGIQFHALRTRQAASRRFVSVHVLVPGGWTVQRGHEWRERIEADIRHTLSDVTELPHPEPVEDPASLEDMGLDRLDET